MHFYSFESRPILAAELGKRQEGSDLASCITHERGYHDICSKNKSLLAYS